MNKTKGDREVRDEWIALFLAGLTLFNWPFLQVFSGNHYYYLFVFWCVFIIIVALVSYSIKTLPEE
jgi:hypothetical protein